jgi:hypothetical protein
LPKNKFVLLLLGVSTQGKRMGFINNRRFTDLVIEKRNFMTFEKLICANSAESGWFSMEIFIKICGKYNLSVCLACLKDKPTTYLGLLILLIGCGEH